MNGLDGLVGSAVEALTRSAGAYLRCVLLKGSAVQNDAVDFIPGLSDLDMHVYLDAAIMRGPVTPTAAAAAAIQQSLTALVVPSELVSALEIAFWNTEDLFSWALQPLPGTYRVQYGALPPLFRHGTAEEYLDVSRNTVARADAAADEVLRWGAGSVDAVSHVRTASRRVKTTLVSAASVINGDPRFWACPVAASIETLATELPSAGAAGSRFYDRIHAWHSVREDGDAIRTLLFSDAVEVLDTIAAGFTEPRPRPPRAWSTEP